MRFFFNDTATTEIYTLSLHAPLRTGGGIPPPARDGAAPRRRGGSPPARAPLRLTGVRPKVQKCDREDRKSTRLNSSHANISYAVFCLKQKKLVDLRCGVVELRHRDAL